MENTYGTFIFNNVSELLICRPYGIKTKTGWSIPKGKAENGETPIQAAIRECFEETGFNLNPYKKDMISVGSKTYKTKKKRIHGFILDLKHEVSIESFFCDFRLLNKEVPEIDKYEWCDLKYAYNRIHEAQSRLLQEYMNSDGG